MVTNEIAPAERERLARAEQRLGWLVAGLGALGTVVVAWRWGGVAAGAFAFGGVLAYLNYRWIVTVVDTLVRAQQVRPTRRTYVKLFAPLGLLAVVLYVIFSRRWLSPVGVVSGILMLGAAVLIELTYQVILELRH